MKSRIN